MKISELPEPYKSLAESRREKDEFSQLTDWVDEAFKGENTLEGWHFWADVHMAQTVADLPPIPPQMPRRSKSNF